MRKRIYRRILLMACGLCLLAIGAPALAVELEAVASATALTEDEEFEVTLTVKGEGMAALEGSFQYDPSLLRFEESNGGAGDGTLAMATAEKGGSASLSAHMRFRTIGAGEAKLSFSIEKALDYGGDTLEGGSAEITVSVAPAPVVEAPKVDYSKEGVPAQNVSGVSEAMYVWKNIENVTIPSKYAETEIDYHGQKVMGAAVADSDAPTLLYLSNAAGENAGYFVYDAAGDKLYRYATLSSVSKSYILLQPDGSVPTPEGFSPSTLIVDEKEIAVWKGADAAGDVYLVYARNPDGEKGFYYYNPEDESLQRYAVLPARPVQPELAEAAPGAPAQAPAIASDAQPASDVEAAGGVPILYVLVLAGALLLVVIVLVVVLASHAAEKKRRRERAAQRRAARERAEQAQAQQAQAQQGMQGGYGPAQGYAQPPAGGPGYVQPPAAEPGRPQPRRQGPPDFRA